MKLFAFLIDSLKKGWGDESSPHILRGFLLVIWHGLRLPVTLVSGGLHALGLLAHKVKLLIGHSAKGFSWFHFRFTCLTVSDAALSRRETKLAGFKSKAHHGLSPYYLLLLTLFLGSVQNAMALDGTSFITKWKTTTANETITIPVNSSLTYLYDIDCDNDSAFEQTGATGAGTCTYATAGEHIIKIQGTFPAIYIDNGAEKDKILDVMQWGNIAWGSMEKAFYGASNLQINATDSPATPAKIKYKYINKLQVFPVKN